jgi:pyruvate formate-lyase/glycerol dehydratase family glycyl radical enzyme
MTPRIARLKAQSLARTLSSGVDRARLVTEAYRNAEGRPISLRRAEALSAVLRGIPIAIHADELIVGDRSCLGPLAYPEFWSGRAPGTSNPEDAAAAADIAAYWSAHPETWAAGTLYGHTVPGFEKVLELGFDGIAAQAELSAFGGNPEQRNVRLAIARVCRAAGDFGRRHADLATRLAADAGVADRRRELLAIAQRCAQVPAMPARTFAEALQSVFFAHMLLQFEDPPNAQSLGRLDQYLWPFYRADTESGRLTEDEARELLACFWVKMWLPYDVQNAMIGGVRPDGADGTNHLSYLILDTLEDVGLIRQTSVRWHSGAPERLLERACDVVAKSRLALPQFFNDDVIIRSLVERGVPAEDARDYSIIGCIEVTIGGRADPRVVAHYSNLAKCLELALDNGVCLLTGQQLGPSTGEPAALRTFDDVWAAYCAQVEHELAEVAERLREAEAAQVAAYPLPALSALTDDCIKRGLDITAGGARYNSTGICCAGIANVADSLAALREVVFERGEATLQEVVEAMRADFAGYEGLRQKLLQAPKYGNDVESVDSIACDVVDHFCRTVEGYRDARGGDFRAHLLSFTLCVPFGQNTAASPDGRRRGEPLANSMAAQQGMAAAGPTAMLRSAAKLEPRKAAAGTSLMLDVHPSAFDGRDMADALASLVEGYFRLGGGHLQFNVANAETLREAQREPERHRGLIVRVSGYSAYFITLDRAMQEHIIARTTG